MTAVIHTDNYQWSRNKQFQTCSLLTAGQRNCPPEIGWYRSAKASSL